MSGGLSGKSLLNLLPRIIKLIPQHAVTDASAGKCCVDLFQFRHIPAHSCKKYSQKSSEREHSQVKLTNSHLRACSCKRKEKVAYGESSREVATQTQAESVKGKATESRTQLEYESDGDKVGVLFSAVTHLEHEHELQNIRDEVSEKRKGISLKIGAALERERAEVIVCRCQCIILTAIQSNLHD